MKGSGAYERFVRPLLFSLDPETAHHFAMRALRLGSRFDLVLRLLRNFQPDAKPKKLFDLTFPHPVGLAAGFDKNGVALPAWEALGFGFVEIGTVTAQPQSGNAKPRIFRFPEHEALINRLGFNNDGADVVAERLRTLRLQGRWPRIPVGINIGKSKITPLEKAPDDYAYSFRLLAPTADYVALNISSPNTPGLRELQAPSALGELLRRLREENHELRKPILLKIAPDLSIGELAEIVAICEREKTAGLIATNTTLDHASIPAAVNQAGGLSGRPLREKSAAVIRALRSLTNLPIVASGGISDAAAAREKMEAGADLVQIYTGYIYRGPALVKEIVSQID